MLFSPIVENSVAWFCNTTLTGSSDEYYGESSLRILCQLPAGYSAGQKERRPAVQGAFIHFSKVND